MNISDTVIEKLKTQVSFGSDADIEQFIADALNTYIELGQLSGAGGMLQVRMPDGATRNLVLHFQNGEG